MISELKRVSRFREANLMVFWVDVSMGVVCYIGEQFFVMKALEIGLFLRIAVISLCALADPLMQIFLVLW